MQALSFAPCLRREVNTTVMTRREFASKLAGADTFLRSVMKGDKLWLKGDQIDLAEPPEDRTSKGSRSQRSRGTKAARSDQAQSGRRREGYFLESRSRQ